MELLRLKRVIKEYVIDGEIFGIMQNVTGVDFNSSKNLNL
jgi:hypothetical protein